MSERLALSDVNLFLESPPWLDARRSSALATFRAKGVPHRRVEDWKYSDLRAALPVDKLSERRSPGFGARSAYLPELETYHFDPEEGEAPRWVQEYFGCLAVDDTPSAAALAFTGSGLALRVPSTFVRAEPIELSYEGGGHARVLIVLEEGALATLIETPVVGADAWFNAAIEIVLHAGASLTHVRLATNLESAVVVENIAVRLDRGARYRANFLSSGAKLSRTDLHATLSGEQSEVELSGANILWGNRHADITTRITHAVPNTTSRQLFKKVAGGKSRAVYQGKITVKEGAIGSDSRQTAKALLLSNHAEADLKPELEILADDVKCAHGAAVGDLDEDSLFYLRSRGIPEKEARGLLIHAFLQEVIDGIENEEMRNSALAFVDECLAQAMRSAG